MSKVISVFKKAPFPAVTTVISFLLFALIYSWETVNAINPHYIRGLMFVVPFIFFGIITFLAAKEKLSLTASCIVTGVLIPIFTCALMFAMVFLAFADDGDTPIRNIDKYERVLKGTNHSLTKYFPKKIPENAKHVTFSYSPELMQAEDQFILKFEVDPDYIDSYIDKFSEKAKWIGKVSDSEASENCVYSQRLHIFGYGRSPEDFTIYVFYSKPNPNGGMEHYSVSFVAISKETNEMIFFAQHW